MVAPSLLLYEHPFALYCQKVLIALHERRLPFEALIEQEDFTREELAELWPMASIPVLRDEAADRTVPETSVIIEYLDGLDADGPRMIPADRDRALGARLWERFFDGYVSDQVQRIVFDALKPPERRDPEAVANTRTVLDTAYDALEAQLAGNEWAAGDEFTIADCAGAPALFYAFALHHPDENRHTEITRYYRALARRPSFALVIEEGRPYRDLFPLPWPDDMDRHHGVR